MSITYVKVFGERNCGTNFLTQILEENTSLKVHRHLPIPELKSTIARLPKQMRRAARERLVDRVRLREFRGTFGWKHACVDVRQLTESPFFSSTLFVFIIRNPFSFLNSLYRRPYNHIYRKWRSKSLFLRTPWLCNLRDNTEEPLLDNPIQLWNLKNQSYSRADCDVDLSSILIRYEDLVTNPDGFHEELQKFCTVSHPRLVVPRRSSKQRGRKSFSEYRDDVVNYFPSRDFSSGDVEFIERHLDRDLLERHYLEWSRIREC